MGLLSNPKTRQKLMNVILRYNNKLCFVCYVVGLCWFLALAYTPFNAKTYFSENALLPGLVKSNAHSDSGAGNYLRNLKDELRLSKETRKQQSIPSSWLEAQLRQLGLDTYVQNFTFKYPVGILKGHAYQGQNVYGILRAPKTASTEAIVLTAPFRPGGSPRDSTSAGIALMLHLAKSFRRHTYWAKDIIFLITEHEEIGIQAWLNAYHHSHNDYVLAGELQGRSGSLQAALCLEIAHEEITRFNIKLEGLNGQLPNLDLVNTAMQLCRDQGMQPTLQKQTDYWDPKSYEGFERALKTMLLMMWNMAHGTPTGNHGLFHQYNVEAVTLQSVRIKNSRRYFSFSQMSSVVEGIFRSLNNLLERFHQSFFFYLLPATNRYVSIGLYMPPFAVLALPVLFKAVALWISVSLDASSQASEETETEGKEKPSQAEGDPTEQTPHAEDAQEPGVTLMSVFPTCVLCLGFGLSAHQAPYYFIEAARGFGMTPSEGLALGAVSVHLVAMAAPWLLQRKATEEGDSGGPNWQLLKSVSLLAFGIVLAAISSLNIAMSFFLAVVWVPVILLVRPTHSRVVNLVQFLLLLLVSPLGLVYIGSVVNEVVVEKVTDAAVLLPRAWESTQAALLMSLINNNLFANWTFSLVSLVIFPTWLMFWSLLWTKPL
ncbi:hypothetical protein NP493_159g04034 [Ridgeia piscesae]|uniref:GPI-anchor transamidase component GPAA1 n=1 Tax=Ridgeia piscesae TaxID=27915 RepID=A0AAD9P405_RIDPI|nr:hypothetical protein NP493_159g04034 [Ridgeia piscesae]